MVWEHLPERTGPTRRIRDRSGVEWVVYERDTAHVPGAHGAHCLVFDSSRAVHRAWRYPADWTSLPDQDLSRLGEVDSKTARASDGQSVRASDEGQ